ncbi:MAG: 16S rRNA (uracil(1498)-N(3))-methyltransferase, partial [Thermoguttaceae bacterium]|nr:16S rRNA (uracil(1498)-N(3))-methyltransferase [Thermoguttaceae bacterium]
MSEHYYISELRELLAEGKAILTGDECQHLTRVMRRKTGDEVLLFDGSGREFVGVLETVDKDRAELTIKETRQIFNEPGIDLTMAVALPKGERQKWLIEKLTELGVRRYIPLAVERADIKFDANVHKRLQRQVIEASKQCGRLRLMEILPEMSRQEITQMFVNQGTRIVTDLEPGPIFSDSQLFPILAHPITDGQFG